SVHGGTMAIKRSPVKSRDDHVGQGGKSSAASGQPSGTSRGGTRPHKWHGLRESGVIIRRFNVDTRGARGLEVDRPAGEAAMRMRSSIVSASILVVACVALVTTQAQRDAAGAAGGGQEPSRTAPAGGGGQRGGGRADAPTIGPGNLV